MNVNMHEVKDNCTHVPTNPWEHSGERTHRWKNGKPKCHPYFHLTEYRATAVSYFVVFFELVLLYKILNLLQSLWSPLSVDGFGSCVHNNLETHFISVT